MSAPAIASRIRLPFPKHQAIGNSATTISYGRPGTSGVASLRLQLWYGQVADRDHVLSASDVLAAGKLPLAKDVQVGVGFRHMRGKGLSGAAQAALWSANKLSGGSASSGVNRGSKRNRVPQ